MCGPQCCGTVAAATAPFAIRSNRSIKRATRARQKHQAPFQGTDAQANASAYIQAHASAQIHSEADWQAIAKGVVDVAAHVIPDTAHVATESTPGATNVLARISCHRRRKPSGFFVCHYCR